MIKNYIKIAFRSLRRNTLFSFVNIGGLAIGLTCSLLIIIYILHEVSYDRFHEKSDRIARVIMDYGGEAKSVKTSSTGTKVAHAFSREMPEVELAVRMTADGSRIVRHQDKVFEEKYFTYADSTFFQIFSFKLLQGSPEKVLAAPEMIVISESAAKKYFGAENPVGKTLKINDRRDLMVTGVMQDFPSNSQMKFDFVASFSTIDASKYEDWWSANYKTYLLLKDKGSIAKMQAKMDNYMKSKVAETEVTGKDYLTYHLEPLTDTHLFSDTEGSFLPTNNISYIYIMSGISLLILFIACFTYINLLTAQSTERAKEVGIRKVIGAYRGQIFRQFLGEAFLTTFLAMVLALVLTALYLPSFGELMDRNFAFDALKNPTFWGVLASLFLVIGFFAGGYPSIVLSNLSSMNILKGTFKTSRAGLWLRKSLIIFQFAISIFLIIGTIVFHHQLSFIQNKKLGYEKEHVLVLPIDGKIIEKLQTIKNELKQNPDVLHVSMSYESPVTVNGGYSMRRLDMPEDKYLLVKALPIDEEFVKTMNLQIITGSDLTEADMKTLNNENFRQNYYHFILNESAARELGWSPQEAIGKKMVVSARNGEVKAVVKDFHIASMRDNITSLVLFPDTYGSVLLAKLSGKNITKTIQSIESQWKNFAPHRPFAYHFLDEEFDALYANERQISKMVDIFTFLAITLACLGLFGLVGFVARQKVKEIGIRKVLGASVLQITTLLSKDFLKLVMIAFVIASPIAYYFMDKWLADFAYRITISWWIFALAGVSAVLIALLTVSWQSIKAAVANPVKSLRSE